MNTVNVQLAMPVGSVSLIDAKDVPTACGDRTGEVTEQQFQQIGSLCSALEQAIAAAEQSQRQYFVSQKDKIVRLSMEIAAKILAKDIREGNYEIEQILLDAIQTIPVSSQMVVRLHPTDLETLRQAIKSKALELPEKLRFVDDPAVGLAECIVESDEGVIEHLIEDHLKQIEAVLGETLNKVQHS